MPFASTTADDMSRIAPLNNATVPIPIVLKLHHAEVAREIIARYDEIEALSQMSVAETRARNDKMDRARAALDAAVAQRHLTLESHRRFAKAMPAKELAAMDAEIEFHKAQLRHPGEEGKKIRHLDMADSEKFVRNRKNPFVLAQIPAVDPTDVDEGAAEQASAKVASLYKQRAITENTERPKDFAKEKIAAELAALAKLGEPSLEDVINPSDISPTTGKFEPGRFGGRIDWPSQFLRPGEDSDRVVNTLAIFVWLNHNTIKEKLFAAIDGRRRRGITIEEKIERVNALNLQIVEALRHENEILRVLEKRGNYSLRQRQAHPAVLLGVEWDAAKIVEYTA